MLPTFWNSDHIFRMGSSHKVCEDYAESSGSTLSANSCHAVLSDGCSLCLDSEGRPIPARTDFGSRILTLAARQQFSVNVGTGYPFGDRSSLTRIAWQAGSVCEKTRLNLNSLSATLLFCYVDGDSIRWFMVGDGVIAWRLRKSKVWHVDSVNFESGSPYYLRYELNENDRNRWFAESSKGIFSTKYGLHSDFAIESTWRVEHGQTPEFIPCIRGWMPIERCDMVAMFSDGIGSFVKKSPGEQPVAIPIIEAITPFLDIKGLKGEFVYRKARMALREYAEQGIVHTDDFSMAAIYVE